MTAQPLVSILINNYNYGRFLGAAIDSALAQTYPNIEVIVVDDGSTDNSAEVIQSYGNRIVPILKENGGQASAFNVGFQRSQGEIICFLDSDDLFTKEKVDRIVAIFCDTHAAKWAFDVVREFDDQNGLQASSGGTQHTETIDIQRLIRSGSCPYVPTATSGLCFRRELLQKILPMPEAIRITSDGYLKWTAMSCSPGVLIHSQLTLQRIHGANLYTKRKTGKLRLSGEVAVNTAFALHSAFPDTQRFALKLLAQGVGAFLATGGLDAAHRDILKSMLTRVSPRLRTDTLLRAGYWAARHKLRRAS